jgi:hypothetical protein
MSTRSDDTQKIEETKSIEMTSLCQCSAAQVITVAKGQASPATPLYGSRPIRLPRNGLNRKQDKVVLFG